MLLLLHRPLMLVLTLWARLRRTFLRMTHVTPLLLLVRAVVDTSWLGGGGVCYHISCVLCVGSVASAHAADAVPGLHVY